MGASLGGIAPDSLARRYACVSSATCPTEVAEPRDRARLLGEGEVARCWCGVDRVGGAAGGHGARFHRLEQRRETKVERRLPGVAQRCPAVELRRLVREVGRDPARGGGEIVGIDRRRRGGDALKGIERGIEPLGAVHKRLRCTSDRALRAEQVARFGHDPLEAARERDQTIGRVGGIDDRAAQPVADVEQHPGLSGVGVDAGPARDAPVAAANGPIRVSSA